MSAGITNDLLIRQGETFTRVIRWETLPFIYTAITAITQGAPATITAAAHGLAANWRAAVLSAGGMRQINAKNMPPIDTEFHPVTVVNSNTVSFNDVDSSDYTAYVSGGFLASYSPSTLAGFSARMKIRQTVVTADPPLVSLVSPADIALDDVNHTITITIAASATALYTWNNAVYDLELVSGAGVVTRLSEGSVTVEPGVTL